MGADRLDRKTDLQGEILLELIDELRINMINGGEKCDGQYTYTEGNKRSCVDYILGNTKTKSWIKSMWIDEEKQCNLGSDHNWIEVEGGVWGQKEKGKGGYKVMDKKKFSEAKEKMINMIINSGPNDYSRVQGDVVKKLEDCKVEMRKD